jgi:tRNA 2-selenouridine synthase
MKYPALLPATDVLSCLNDYDSIIDVRSQSEFALDHLPGAINCPVLNDAERVEVGTLYKQTGAFEAKKIGAALVAHNIAGHLKQAFADKPRGWKPLIYCWRGGNRSGAMAHILAKIGWPAVQLDGGYREYRRTVLNQLDTVPLQLTFRVICGTTGSGKSRLLTSLANQGAQVLDLEQLAAHRGSVLGGLPDAPQPTQKMFESLIWQQLLGFTSTRPVYVESESRKIGQLRVPEKLMEKIRASACIHLQTSTANRVALLIEDYPHLVTDTEMLMSQLEHLFPLHGHEKIREWRTLAEAAQIERLVEELLRAHYDPAYLRSIEKNFSGYTRAKVLVLHDISTAAFDGAARQLLDDESLALMQAC